MYDAVEKVLSEVSENSTPNGGFDLLFYSSPAPDPSGFGEGQTYVGETKVTTNARGTVSFSFSTPTPLAGGQSVTATATKSVAGDTSEFSQAMKVSTTR